MLDISHGLDSVIDSPFRSGELNLPEKKDFVPKGDRVPSTIDIYFHQEDILNDGLVEFTKPKLVYPHLMTPRNFRQILNVMVQLLHQKAKDNPGKASRIKKAADTLEELDENMDLLMIYLASLYKA